MDCRHSAQNVGTVVTTVILLFYSGVAFQFPAHPSPEKCLPFYFLMRSDWRVLRFISALWASVIRDYAPYPSLFHKHVSHQISISPAKVWQGSLWWPVLVTLRSHDKCGGGGVECAHELGMTSPVHSTLRVLHVPPKGNLPDKWPPRGGR